MQIDGIVLERPAGLADAEPDRPRRPLPRLLPDFGWLLAHEPLAMEPAPDPAAPATIFFTSGSTGPAKGVTHTRDSLCWMIASAVHALELTARDVLVPGWLGSGDLARADEDGYLWFFGRKKQVIVHDGSNISQLEVEGALADHPAIDLAGVVGIDDKVHGENVRAYVTVRPGAAQPASADLIAHCRERVGYKAPEEVVFLAEMPLNPTGKIDRVGLKRMAEDHLHPHGLGD